MSLPDPFDQIAFIGSAAFIGYFIVRTVIRISEFIDGVRDHLWKGD